jgi:Flp pilus assembly protein TadB
MACARCHAELPAGMSGWCADCERAYDTWIRGYAADIVVPALAAATIIMTIGVVLPVLGVGWLIATTGVFAGFGTMVGVFRLRRRRRRAQFLATSLPRAYLPGKT